jgi:transposase-like protein
MAEAEIITRRRKWRVEEKATLLAEVEAEGGRVSVVARRHGISESLLYNWRSLAKTAAPTNGPERIEFRPIGVIGGSNEAQALLVAGEHRGAAEEHRQERASKIEIELVNGVRVRVHASVSGKALSRVLRAVAGAM